MQTDVFESTGKLAKTINLQYILEAQSILWQAKNPSNHMSKTVRSVKTKSIRTSECDVNRETMIQCRVEDDPMNRHLNLSNRGKPRG